MTSDKPRLYSRQDLLSAYVMESAYYPAEALGYRIGAALSDIAAKARVDGRKLDWDTLAITTRRDNLIDGTLLSTRIHSAS